MKFVLVPLEHVYAGFGHLSRWCCDKPFSLLSVKVLVCTEGFCIGGRARFKAVGSEEPQRIVQVVERWSLRDAHDSFNNDKQWVKSLFIYVQLMYMYLFASVLGHWMLFDRFVFVLYLLLGYMWFLLGTVYESEWRFVSIVLMMLTLFSTVVISLLQLQILLLKNAMQAHDKWSTIAWSVHHLLLCIVLCADGLEWMNIVVVLGFCGVVMTLTIAVVSGCACFVIMQNGEDWHAHIHLTCISFWVMLQFMSTRLPADNVLIIRTIPVVLMSCIRVFEGVSWRQMPLWGVGIVLHVLRDTGVLSQLYFLWMLSTTLVVLAFVHRRAIRTLVVIPFALVPTILFIILRMCCGTAASTSLIEVVRLYNEFTARDLEPIVLPLDEDADGADWGTSL